MFTGECIAVIIKYLLFNEFKYQDNHAANENKVADHLS